MERSVGLACLEQRLAGGMVGSLYLASGRTDHDRQLLVLGHDVNEMRLGATTSADPLDRELDGLADLVDLVLLQRSADGGPDTVLILAGLVLQQDAKHGRSPLKG